MFSIDLICALFVFGQIVGPIIRIWKNSDNHVFGVQQNWIQTESFAWLVSEWELGQKQEL